MKTAILMSLAGAGLFVGTVVGLLAFQGRLNSEGTQGVPVLEGFFADGTQEGDDGHGGAAGADGHAAGDGHAEPDAHAAAPGGAAPERGAEGARVKGLGRETPLPRAVGPSIASVEVDAGRPADGRDPQDPHGADPHGASGAPDSGRGAGPGTVTDHDLRAEVLMGQGQYRRGKLFDFGRLDSGMSVEELNELATALQEREATVKRRLAALEQREADLEARAADIEERERAVLQKMREVLQARGQLEEEFNRFEATYTMVRSSEVEQFQAYASQMAALDAEQSSQIIQQMWKTEQGKTKAVKILKFMPREATDEIFGTLGADQLQEILDRMAGTVVEQGK